MVSRSAADRTMTTLRLESGVLHMSLDGAVSGPVDLVIDGETVASVSPSNTDGGASAIAFPLPRTALNDGTTTVVFSSAGEVLGQYLLMAGQPVKGDLHAEIELLSAELDALKRAFLAEARDTKLRAIERPLIIADAVEAVRAAVPTMDGSDD